MAQHDPQPVKRDYPPQPLEFLRDSADIIGFRDRVHRFPLLGLPFTFGTPEELAAHLVDLLTELVDQPPAPGQGAHGVPDPAPGMAVALNANYYSASWMTTPAYAQALLGVLAWRTGCDNYSPQVAEDLLRTLVDPDWAEITEPPGPRTRQGHRIHRWLAGVAECALPYLHDVLVPHGLRLSHYPRMGCLVVDRLTVAEEPHRAALTADDHGVVFALDGGAGRGPEWVDGQVVALAHSMGWPTRLRDLELARRAAVENTATWSDHDTRYLHHATDDALSWLNTRRCPGGYRYDFTEAGTFVLRLYGQTADDVVAVAQWPV